MLGNIEHLNLSHFPLVTMKKMAKKMTEIFTFFRETVIVMRLIISEA